MRVRIGMRMRMPTPAHTVDDTQSHSIRAACGAGLAHDLGLVVS